MSSKKPNSFIFALIMCLVCSIGLTFTAVSLKEKQDFNKKIDKQKNILKALGEMNAHEKVESDKVAKMYEEKVRNYFVDKKSGEISKKKAEGLAPIYMIENGNKVVKYAVPFKAYGLWSYIYGILAFDEDGETVIGFTVFQHGETPGLGGEVEKDWFQNQFKGKKILDNNGKFVSIGITKGKVKDKLKRKDWPNYVDGISGATLTGDGVQRDLKTTLKSYEPFARKLR